MSKMASSSLPPFFETLVGVKGRFLGVGCKMPFGTDWKQPRAYRSRCKVNYSGVSVPVLSRARRSIACVK
ncbi:hypothetical protein TRIATDRAFT_300406 [Trichoderma atroviride IMI 206040]|uniref:Uncharacterized protein n=1 Tax=Hypocrea atroviridis (strain ATCC 20476 / IMI 206040) TaxID=452589 RepID=G9P032_HYPAI|nr:uncharacterized protein TRIATDRAFT_300406 [Trichoderma atroviride IMI 206040]EHK44078.1 hypothetical protein TRIATDRAFT_300406 [Trichoderma atroviride IMI 206040]